MSYLLTAGPLNAAGPELACVVVLYPFLFNGKL